MNRTTKRITAAAMRRLPKILLHEHLDCSLRPATMLDLWSQIGFDNAKLPFPEKVRTLWEAASSLQNLSNRGHHVREAASPEQMAADAYQRYLARYARASLANYVQAIVDHVLPLMQDAWHLYTVTQQRIDDAVADGIIAAELRFAPQLHTQDGMTLDGVMQAVIKASEENAKIPVKWIICCLRHEDAKMARRLGDLALKHQEHVGAFDLAADEELNPGVLDWWLEEALRVRRKSKGKIDLTIHLTETRKATARDRKLIRDNNITRIGHGIKGDWSQYLEVCPTSNVVTGQVASFAEHPIDSFYRQGKLVTVNTDGTLFTRSDLTQEYLKLQRYHGWGHDQFYIVNGWALQASSFDRPTKERLLVLLNDGYDKAR